MIKYYFGTKRGFIVKTRVSATIDEKTEKLIISLIKKGKYRNKSHVIEDAIKKLAKGEINNA